MVNIPPLPVRCYWRRPCCLLIWVFQMISLGASSAHRCLGNLDAYTLGFLHRKTNAIKYETWWLDSLLLVHVVEHFFLHQKQLQFMCALFSYSLIWTILETHPLHWCPLCHMEPISRLGISSGLDQPELHPQKCYNELLDPVPRYWNSKKGTFACEG